jgi:hypothetical protein
VHILRRMIYITEVHMSSDGSGHEHIEEVRWERQDSPQTGTSTVEEMVDWIDNKDGFAHVRDSEGHDARVGVVRPENGRPYIRTYADPDEWKDDLLDLPRY